MLVFELSPGVIFGIGAFAGVVASAVALVIGAVIYSKKN